MRLWTLLSLCSFFANFGRFAFAVEMLLLQLSDGRLLSETDRPSWCGPQRTRVLYRARRNTARYTVSDSPSPTVTYLL